MFVFCLFCFCLDIFFNYFNYLIFGFFAFFFAFLLNWIPGRTYETEKVQNILQRVERAVQADKIHVPMRLNASKMDVLRNFVRSNDSSSHFPASFFFVFSPWCLDWCRKNLGTGFGPLKPGYPCRRVSTGVSRW